VNILTTKALQDKKMSVFGGDQWRPLLHVKDVANAIDKTVDGDVNGIFNLHHKNYKIIELAEKIKEKIPDVVVETTPLPFQDTRNYQVSSEKLKAKTGFEALIDLDQGINEVYELIASNRIKDINDPRYSNQSFLQTYGVS
jgi:nucleoside-diphosphate-sugar epimerase